MRYMKNTKKIRAITSSAAAIASVVSWVDLNATTGAWVDADSTATAISSVATTDVSGTPASGNVRTMKQGTWRNKDASLSCDLTICYYDGSVDNEEYKCTLLPGQTLMYIEGIGFFILTASTIRSGLRNSSSADQSIGASATAYLTGSAITLPSTIPIGTVLEWDVWIAKSAAATATETFAIRFGTAGTTADTARNSFTGDTETAAADEALLKFIATIRGPISASCIVEGGWMMNDNLTTTGFSNTARKAQIRQATSAAFDITPAGTIAGLSIATGASHAITVRQVHSRIWLPGT